jgi:subtilisin family serine protease
MLLALFLAVGSGLQAQIKTTTFNNNPVKENSIVVKYDDTMIAAKGKAVSPQTLAADIRTQFNASIGRTLGAGSVEEWLVSGDMSAVLNQLNRIPGVTAFPNYVFYRDDMELTPVSGSLNGLSSSLSDAFQAISPVSSSNRTGDEPNFDQLKNIEPSILSDVTIVNGPDDSFPLYFEDFNNATEVAASWIVTNDGSGDAWELIEVAPGDSAFVVGDTAGVYMPFSDTSVLSPYFDMSGVDMSKAYVLTLDHMDALEGFGFDDLLIGVWAGDSLYAAYDLTQGDGLAYSSAIPITSVAGEDSVWFSILMYSDDSFEAGFGAMFDNVGIFQTTLPETSDPLLSLQYGLNNDGSFTPGYSVEGADVDAFAAWDVTTGSDDVVFVVYDDGVDFSHPDLFDNRWVNPGEDLNDNGMIDDDEINGIDDDGNGYVDDFWGWSSVYDDNTFINSGSFHGTHVAGILGAQGDNEIGISGVAQDVSIINVMIFNEFGGTDAISIMAGYEYISVLLDAGVPITGINQSWGGGGFLDLESDQQFVSVMTAYALDHAEHAALWIVSAGNNASNRDELPFYSYPNNIQAPNIVTVASSDDADALSGFSDFGEFTVDVSAPGSAIISTVPPSTTGLEYAYLSGTSMASPHVSGILALAKAANPGEDGFDLLARLLAGNEDVPSLDGFTGEGGRVNAASTLSPEATPTAQAPLTHFHRTFVDGTGLETVGFVNTSGGPLTVTGTSITGANATNFSVISTETPTIAAGEAFGLIVEFNNMGVTGDLTATLEVATDGATVSMDLIGHEQGFGLPYIDPFFHDFGAVPYGTELGTSFTLYNDGTGDLDYSLQQALFFFDLEFSNLLDELDRFQPANSNVDKGIPGDKVEFLDKITARVMLERGDRVLPKIQYVPGNHEIRELGGPEVIFSDSLNDAVAVAASWDLQTFGGVDEFWELVDISEDPDDTNNVFLFGDLLGGYVNDAISVAIPPAFDFSGYEAGRGPAYLVFDAEAELEQGWDDFYVNVISNGSRLATIAGTFDGSIPNFGGYNTVWVDISQFAGLDDVEFWFIANSDASVVDGFGALFDNVEVIVDDLPFFTSSGGGTIAPGESEIIDITIRTELLPPGDFVLYTDVFSNGFISYYGGGALFHTSQFSARNVALEIDPMEDWIGEASTEEATVFSFDADNIGTVGVDYFADVMIAYDFMDDFFGDGLVQGRDAALGRFAESNKGPGSPIDLVQHRNVILDNLSSRTGISNGSNRTADVPRMSPSREDLDIYFEDFETGLNEGWEIFDFSFGLGHAFNVENWGSVDFPDNFLNVGGISENGWFIFNDTYTLAFSESFDLSAVPNSDEVVMEFTYSFLLEPGFDFGSVWIGVETEDGTELYLVGSSEDIFWNDGFVYRTGIDISEFAGMDGVFMAFLVETDGSVQSGWTGFNDLDVYTTERLAYIDPYEGSIDVGESQTFNVTVNTPWLYPGDYIAISVIDYYSEDLFVGRSAEQFTYFEIPNMKPVAEDDFLAVITDEIIPIDYILGMMFLTHYLVISNIHLMV